MENWTWGMSLIALTIAIHRDRRSVYGLRTVNIRLRLESKNRLGSHQVFAIIIGLIAAVGLLPAALHAIEAALWAAAY